MTKAKVLQTYCPVTYLIFSCLFFSNIANSYTVTFLFQVIASPQENGQVIVFLRSLRDQRAFRGFMLMAEVNGDRGHGYFVPADESAELAATMDCENLPVTCADEAACQGFANAIAHSSPEDKVAVTAIWTPPSQMSGQVRKISK